MDGCWNCAYGGQKDGKGPYPGPECGHSLGVEVCNSRNHGLWVFVCTTCRWWGEAGPKCSNPSSCQEENNLWEPISNNKPMRLF